MGNGAEDGRAENKDRWNGIVTAQSNFVTKILKETKTKKGRRRADAHWATIQSKMYKTTKLDSRGL